MILKHIDVEIYINVRFIHGNNHYDMSGGTEISTNLQHLLPDNYRTGGQTLE